MNYSRKIVDAAYKEFEDKRTKRNSLSARRLNEVYSLCPEIIKIDAELSTVGPKIMNAAMLGKDGIAKRIEALRDENLALQKRRAQLLEGLGFDKDYTEPPYECDKCNDSGYIGTELCTCFKKTLIEKAYEATGFTNLLKTQSFDNFKPDCSSEDVREKMLFALKVARTYADKFDEYKSNLLFIGGTGLGKTHLSTAIAKQLIDNGYNVVYESAQTVFTDFARDYYYPDKTYESLSDRYLTADLLIIDDLGSEMITNHSRSALYNIINTRINKGLPIICSTNYSAADLNRLYDERIFSRIFGEFKPIIFEGRDKRRK